MMILGYLASLQAALLIPADPASVAESSGGGAIVIPTWSPASMADALRRFPPAQRRPTCFGMRIAYAGERLVVEFIPKNDRIEKEDSIILNASTCGKGAIFNYRLGKLEKGYFVR
jgi:hypothetical protein